MEKKRKPTKLDFSALRDYVRNGFMLFPQYAYVANDFAVLRSFRLIANSPKIFEPPYRLDELRVGVVTSGYGNITVNLIDYKLREGMLIYVKGGSIVQPNTFSSDFDMEAVSVSDDLLQLLFNGRIPSCFIGDVSNNGIPIPQSERDVLHHIIESLWVVIHQKDIGSGVIHSLLTAVLCLYEDINARNITNVISSTSHEREVFMKFINFVHRYSKKERKLSFYADKLCLSQHYLGTLIREASGTTAKEWIERSVVAEAKVMLKNSDMLTYQISDELNFPNVSFFCKFFKRLTGMTPLEYQRS
jgi:AraC family transcriptional regulator, transcriptional activator of pobA